jgi:para-nitrobenzyl esterase
MTRIHSIILFAAIASNAAAATVDVVRVDSGALKGAISGGVVAFKGIPYAAPPIGNNRWRSPLPPKPWQGVRSAAAYASDCMQLPFPSDAAPLGTTPAEDCLYLNVWSPIARSSGKLPVMVWIYGGGFVNGGSSPAVYDGTHFAESGVVFVSFNYRVGRFGFFAFPALTKEDPHVVLANYCYLDQIAALQWVRRNIAEFGGDPENVTLFGESAGGMSVLTMMTSPLARGLFDKAIIESGGGRTNIGPMRRVSESAPNLPSGEAVGMAFAEKAGIKGQDAAALAALRALSAERVCDRLNMASMGNPTYAGPMIDGRIVVETSEQALLAGHAMKIPVMVGANSSDIGFSFAKNMDELFAPFGANLEKAETIYDPEKSGAFRKIGMVVASDRMMVEPARFVARTVAASGQRAYEYRFSHVAESMRKQWKGAPHATEIPFVFDTVAARYGKDLAAADEATAKAALAYWVAFAKTGNPDGEGRPHWPAYDAAGDQLMNFTMDGPVAERDAWKARLDLTEAAAQSK